MLWVLLSIFASWALIVQIQINQKHKYSGIILNNYRSLFSTGLLVPFIPFMEFPQDVTFYLVCFLTAAISVVCMTVQYNLAAKKNGRVANLHQPLVIFLTFIAWLIIDQSQLEFFKDNWINSFLVVLSFLVLFVSIQHIRKNDIGWEALKAVIPIALLYSVLVIASKLILETGQNAIAISLCFVFVSNFMMCLMIYPLIKSRFYKETEKVDVNRTFMISTFGVAFFHTVSWILISLAFILAPNAAYPVAITSLCPVWFMIYYWVTKQKDDASPVAGLVMACGATLLVLAGQ
tara:strand:+ start:87 stop:959 length:873 start_codon:yes stop_codon:yes gene_type:complete